MKNIILRFTLLTLFAAVSLSALAEDCLNGPSGINSNVQWIAHVTVPKGRYVELQFNFNAAWENMVFVCTAQTGERIAVKGNYFRDREKFVSPIDRDRDIRYTIAAFHKKTSPDDHNAPNYPWRQSAMRVLLRQRSLERIGFNDEGGPGFENAVVTIHKVGFE
jgi:hypothetical protein